MGNKGGQATVDKSVSSYISLTDKEKEEAISFAKEYINAEDKSFNADKYFSDTFLILADKIKQNIIPYLNSYYVARGIKRTVQKLEVTDLIFLANILIKANGDCDDEIYNRKNTILILYDILKGKVRTFEENSSDINIDDVLPIFNFALLIYMNKYAKHSSKMKQNEDFTPEFTEEIKEFLKSNILTENQPKITLSLLEEFIDTKLYAIDSFLKNHFKIMLLNRSSDEYYISLLPFPLFNDPPSLVPVYQFFYFCLSNSSISSKSYAFKLYDCKIQGYNLSNLIYSFIGFTGPISIMVQHYDEDQDKVIILGMFINSNFKECYEKFCGDDMSYIFTLDPKMTTYRCVGDKDKILYICSKSQKFSKSQPGIGMGCRGDQIRFWLDSNELFSKSVFCKYDNTFEEGSPFKEPIEKLNIGNIEVFGYGDEDALESLMKKQERDRAYCDKMKKVDKSAFVNNEFDKEMFFSKGFAHREQTDERGYNKEK